MDLERLYSNRFTAAERAEKARYWKVLYDDFLARYVRPDDCVLDLAAGTCDFVNNARCRRRIAVDLNEEARAAAAPGVEFVHAPATDLSPIAPGTVDVVFVSNFFEHLPSKADLLATLGEIRRVLRPGGRVLVIQPNIRLIPGAYWDFVDHHLPLTDRSLVEALEIAGLRPVEVRARFLPYTTKTRLPKATWLLRLYLRLRPAQWLFGKQTWVVAERPAAA
jgi:SAM-dependent methyltransferase